MAVNNVVYTCISNVVEMCVMRGGGICVSVIQPRSNHKLVMNVCVCAFGCLRQVLWVLMCRNRIYM